MSLVLAVNLQEILVSLSIVLTTLTILGVAIRVVVNGFHRLDKLRDEQEWVRTQMQANGPAKDAGTEDATLREVLDLTVDRSKNLASLAVDSSRRLERIEENQRDQGTRLRLAIAEHDRFTQADVRHDEAIAELTRTVEALRRMFEAHMEGHQ